MKRLITILLLLASFLGFAQTNSISRLYVRDEARDWVIVETYGSIGTTMPGTANFEVTALHPDQVRKISDTSFGLRFAADFTEGASIKLDYIPDGGLLGNLPSQDDRVITNYITSAAVFYWTVADHLNYYSDYDTYFNSHESIPANSIIVVQSGFHGAFEIDYADNPRFVVEYTNDDSAVFTYINFREKVINPTFMGHPARGDKNLKIRSTYAGYFGMGIYATGDITLENIEIYNVSQGIQVKTVADLDYEPYNLSRLGYQALFTKNIYIHDTSEEAWYVGSDVSSPILISWTGYGLTCNSIGRDAYQYRNGNWVWLKNCSMTSIGQTENDNHSHGFLYGTNTGGGWVENLTGSDIYGNGILINGYGNLTFKNCTISSRMNNPYIKNYDDHDDQFIGYLVVNFICNNSFDCTGTGDPRTPDIRRDPAKTAMTINISDGTVFAQDPYIEDGVHGGINNGIVVNFTTTCPTEEQHTKSIPVGSVIRRYIH